MTRVCHVSTVHDPFDVRVFYKECVSLTSYFETFLVIKVEKSATKSGVHLIPIKTFKFKFIRLVLGPMIAFFKALETKAELFHLHDPELLVLTPWFKLLGKKVIYDKHENVAGQIMNKKWLGPKWIRVIVSWIYKLAERIFTSFCDKIVVVIPEMENEFPSGKAILVRNFPSQKAFENIEIRRKDNSMKFVYAGGLTPERGILEMIKAFGDANIDAELLLIGKWSSKSFQNMCLSNNNSGKVRDVGFVPMEKVYEMYGECHIGLCLLHPTENYKRSLPVKVFEYYFAGLKVIMSDIEYWKKEFGDRAIYADPYSHEELVNVFKDADLQFKGGGLDKDHSLWAKSIFSWESEFKNLLSAYQELLKEKN